MSKKRKPLSHAAQLARKPPPPWALLNAIQEPLSSSDDRIAELEAAVEAARRDLDEQWIEEEKRERERQGDAS